LMSFAGKAFSTSLTVDIVSMIDLIDIA